MTSDTTPHSTHPDGDSWAVTWLPGRVLTRNQAITAMVLAETAAGGIGDHTGKRWLFIEDDLLNSGSRHNRPWWPLLRERDDRSSAQHPAQSCTLFVIW